jgi:histidinol phosphatase-like enzyme (inositol monophosphatase family)
MILTRPDHATLLEAAETLATEAGAITLQYYGNVLDSESKGDGTPVTVADRAAETFLRREILERFPSHGILGEEFGQENPDAPIQWILDPIDGTKSFMRGVPLYGVLIGVVIEGNPSVGVAHFPALGETISAALGEGCRWNGRPARVSPVTELAQAAVLTSDPAALLDDPMTPGWTKLIRTASLARSWGDCYGHILVATGRADVMVDPILSPWDAAPFVPILSEAGGRFTDKDGLARHDGGTGISTNGVLHEEVLEVLRGG